MTPEQITTYLIVLYVGACLGLYGVISLMSKFEDETYADESHGSTAKEVIHLLYFCCLDEKDGDKFLFYAGLIFNLIVWALSLSILALMVFVSIQ